MEVYKQYEDIDLCFTFNGNTILIMEDKTSSTSHNNQFEDHKSIAEAWCTKNLGEYKIKFVYYKTDDYTTQELKNVKESSYKAIGKKDALPILERYYNSAYGDFVRDYYLYLSKIETIGNEVFEKSFDDIKHSIDYLMNHVIEFCNYFSDRIGADWKCVTNPNKPFIVMSWNWYDLENGEFFLQFENFDFKIKICINELYILNNMNISDIRNVVLRKVDKVIKNHGYNISKPAKKDVAKKFTVGCIDESM